jgi:hypothetical protein
LMISSAFMRSLLFASIIIPPRDTATIMRITNTNEVLSLMGQN